jgi:hypothetical protein
MSNEPRRARPSLGAVFSNFHTFDAPFLTKLRMAAHNNWIKARTGTDCCGNGGQPGC